MTLKDKMRTYNFWISLVSAIVLLMRVIGNTYGFSVDSGLIMDLTTGVCGIFVILGIISVPQKSSVNSLVANQNKVEGECMNDSLNDNNLEYKKIFDEMSEKLQNNLNKIEIIANNNKNIENIDTEIVLNDDLKIEKDNETVLVEYEDDDENIDIIESCDLLNNSSNLSNFLTNEIIEDDKSLCNEIIVNENACLENKIEEVCVENCVNENVCFDNKNKESICDETKSQNTIAKLDEILASLSIDEIQKLKSMI